MIEKPVRLAVMTTIKTKGVDRGGRACAIPELELPCAIHVRRLRSGSRRGRRRDGNVASIRLIADVAERIERHGRGRRRRLSIARRKPPQSYDDQRGSRGGPYMMGRQMASARLRAVARRDSRDMSAMSAVVNLARLDCTGIV